MESNSLERLLQSARFYRLAVQEFQRVDIEIGNEISDKDLENYDKNLHENIFPGLKPEEILELSGDGIEKLIVKVGSDNAPKKRAGRPSQRQKKVKPYSNGWFVICCP